MKFYVSALVLLLAAALVIGHDVPCSVDETIKSILSQHYAKLELECVFVKNATAYSNCPEGQMLLNPTITSSIPEPGLAPVITDGYTATGCSCGMGCGSWDLHSSNVTCHCQCANIDWTAARCCRMKLQ